ncbi:HAD-IIA family hydrolase [Alloiococcus sp. CFN-8]|uniref:HAD-IIA family hydrolase n=1 Tax=Alloiococcus sp. CFN-8 TaxID=3416081 RepID=UPI003CFA93BA
MHNLNKIKCFLLDMDGTIYLGGRLIPGALEFLDILKNQEKRYIFLTNNSSKGKDAYIKKLSGLGIEVGKDMVYSSGDATIYYINNIKPGARIFLLGTPTLEEDFRSAGFEIVKERDREIDFVVLGFDTTLTYEKIWIACDYIKAGATYIATHGDIVCPLEDNKTMPDVGAMIEMIKAATGQAPKIMGKPEEPIIEAITEKYSLKREEIAMVGDRLYTDIKMGEVAGITSILVYSGETTEELYSSSDIRASYEFPSVKELGDAIIKDKSEAFIVK